MWVILFGPNGVYNMFAAVFFDLDGTLVDTAPDLGAALNAVLVEEGHSPLPLARTRPVTSQGVRGLLRIGFNISPEEPGYAGLAERVLIHYEKNICVDSCLFPAVDEVLAHLEKQAISWGIVTNKHSRFTLPLVQALKLDTRAKAIISGDSAARAKPAPDTLLLAAQQAQVSPQDCLYIGDDLRDVLAGHAAGMKTLAIRWGYLGEDKPIEEWGADYIIATPEELLAWLQLH